MSLTPEALKGAEENLRLDWDVIHIFHDAKSIITLPPSKSSLPSSEANALPLLFSSREYAFRAGIELNSQNFDVHQWESTRGVDLVYGRQGDAVSGVGACAFRMKAEDQPEVYGAISYSFPSLSTNAVSKLISFLHEIAKKTKSLPNPDPLSSKTA
ncbi:unnamed protein product [Agarophyton chilense]